MSVKSSRGSLAKAVRDLHVSWHQTQNYWRDDKAKEFDEKYITPLPDAINSASSIIEELDQILTKIKRDCE
jgi:hypothetical protein